jgi:hypothetical protein
VISGFIRFSSCKCGLATRFGAETKAKAVQVFRESESKPRVFEL